MFFAFFTTYVASKSLKEFRNFLLMMRIIILNFMLNIQEIHVFFVCYGLIIGKFWNSNYIEPVSVFDIEPSETVLYNLTKCPI